MTTEILLRTLAVAAAIALVAQPYWRDIVAAAAWLWDVARGHASTAARLAAAGLIVAALWGVVPVPTVPAQPTVYVQTPSPEMQKLVAPIARALAPLPMSDRLLWASTWSKAAVVVAGEPTAKEPAFTDTRSLRAFTSLALDIAWRRIGGREPGRHEPLRTGVEAAYDAVLGSDVVPVTRELCGQYAELARAVAWAGLNGE